MGAGGIIQKHTKLLVTSLMHPSFYNQMNDDEKNDVEAINLKAELDCTADDLSTVVGLVNKYQGTE